MTWNDFSLMVTGYNKRLLFDVKLTRSLAYKICEYSFQRPKKMTPLNEFWQIEEEEKQSATELQQEKEQALKALKDG